MLSYTNSKREERASLSLPMTEPLVLLTKFSPTYSSLMQLLGESPLQNSPRLEIHLCILLKLQGLGGQVSKPREKLQRHGRLSKPSSCTLFFPPMPKTKFSLNGEVKDAAS